MTDTVHPPPPAVAAHREGPFARGPERRDRERSRTLLTGHVRDHACSPACELVRLDARAGTHVYLVECDGPCRYPQGPATLHTFLVQAAAGSDRCGLRRSAEGGHTRWPRPASSPTSGRCSNSPTR